MKFLSVEKIEILFNSPKENTLSLSAFYEGIERGVAELDLLDCGTYLHAKSAAIAESGNLDGNKSLRWSVAWNERLCMTMKFTI